VSLFVCFVDWYSGSTEAEMWLALYV
jgi:hypothetical protein